MAHKQVDHPVIDNFLCSYCGAIPPSSGGFTTLCPANYAPHCIVACRGILRCSFCASILPPQGFTGPCPSNQTPLSGQADEGTSMHQELGCEEIFEECSANHGNKMPAEEDATLIKTKKAKIDDPSSRLINTSTLTQLVVNSMIDKTHINGISDDGMKLFNRDDTFATLNSQLKKLNHLMINKNKLRTNYRIPMLAGSSGIGKTVSLQRCSEYLKDIPYSIACHVTIYNGYGLQPSERTLPSPTVLALRMLFFMFLNDNSPLVYDQFLEEATKLGDSLVLDSAFEVVESIYVQATHKTIKHRNEPRSSWKGEFLTVVLCIDECQEFNKTQASDEDLAPLDSICQELLNVMMAGRHIVLPILAGTDFEAALTWSLKGLIKYIPLPPVNPTDVIESCREVVSIPITAQVRALAFDLNVPRHIAIFMQDIAELCPTARPGENVVLSVWRDCKELFDIADVNIRILLKVIAHAITKLPVDPTVACCKEIDKTITWKKVRRSGLCVFRKSFTTAVISVSYYTISACTSLLKAQLMNNSMEFESKEDEELVNAISQCLTDLAQLLIATGTYRPQWEAWEEFGALYEALKINCFLYVGHKTIALKELYDGCLVSGCDMIVRLLPTRVAKARTNVTGWSFECVLGKHFNWDGSEGICVIVLNHENGTGWDYMFSLPIMHAVQTTSQSLQHVVVKNQRKTIEVNMGDNKLQCVRKSAIAGVPTTSNLPNCCVEVIGISSFFSDNDPNILPSDVYYLGRNQCTEYHGDLRYHPAATPYVDLNYANQTAIIHALEEGTEKEKLDAARAIIAYRERLGRYCTIDEFRQILIDEGLSGVVRLGEWVYGVAM